MAASDTAILIITYNTKNCFILLNDCKNTYYFPTIFPYNISYFVFFGDSGYLRNK